MSTFNTFVLLFYFLDLFQNHMFLIMRLLFLIKKMITWQYGVTGDVKTA